jgi:protoheme IX farnesyltransferase
VLQKFKDYYLLTKPGIIRGNAVHILAGALFASTTNILWKELLGVLVGTSIVIASACVANNYMDRGIDARMKRTKERPSVTGKVSLKHAMIYATVLLIIGLAVLYITTNLLVISIGLIAYVLYVFAYGLAKRRTVHSTLIGAIPGALPAMAGYVAITGQLSVGAWLVFLLVFAWQMPHFYAISVFRKQDYQSAGLPVLGAVRSFDVVKHYILSYMLLYIAVIALLIATKTVGAPAGLLLLAGAAYWVFVYFRASTDNRKWALSIFGASLVLTLLLVVAAGLNMLVSGTV